MSDVESPIADALFSKTQQRLLRLFFGQPERSFYTQELVRLVGMGIGTVQRELARLTEAGLLVQSQLGNQKHYQANAACPVFADLRAIVAKTFGVADVLKQALVPFADKLALAFVYGSLAKGEAHADSDIDLMVVGDDVAYAQLMEGLVAAEEQLGRAVNPTVYGVGEFRRKLAEGNTFLLRVMQQPKILITGSLDGFGESTEFGKDQSA